MYRYLRNLSFTLITDFSNCLFHKNEIGWESHVKLLEQHLISILMIYFVDFFQGFGV